MSDLPTPDGPGHPPAGPAPLGSPAPATAMPAPPASAASGRGPRRFSLLPPVHGRANRTARKTPSRAGRNLPAAIGVGLALLAALIVGLLFSPLLFTAFVAAFVVVGVFEFARAMAFRQVLVPRVPLAIGAAALPFAAYLGGPEVLTLVYVAACLLAVLWRAIDPRPGAPAAARAGVLALTWIPLMVSFALLLLRTHDGALKLITMLLLVVANDTFGYLVGVLFGRHAMAPRVSPKKTWEGFGGSIVGAAVIGLLCATLLLGQPWWVGSIMAVATVGAATLGDLAESMVKREVGIKDMGTILPGHGGVMDRLDSIVLASPVAFLMFELLMPQL
ncbi:phosphatidate cytidylyltransferase [Tersicoccus sp. Bi-70]|uniref:phosphatidate cytidylyltransferase n=1 Tax=Tersicoccus sp. Bi-70 TaxID=1897634 RepID=UPI001E2AC3D8|nr:phosphatidate cytidylyltransferase [Tersicoccus sp. Bi-70]